jgi:hypothetical protein
MSVVTQLCFQIVEEINYMFRPFSGWAIFINGDDATKDYYVIFVLSTA